MAEAAVGFIKAPATVVLNKIRKTVAEELRNRDVVDEGIANVIIPDAEDVKMNLKALKRTHLQASINFYNEGVESIAFDAMDSPRPIKRRKIVIDNRPAAREDVAIFAQANVKLSPDSKERFKDARREAVLALSNTALKAKNSVLAMYVKVMVQLLEGADDPTRALLFCKGYIEDMHGMETIKANFQTEFEKTGPRKRLKKETRRNIISYVYLVNRVVFDIAQSFGGDRVFRDLFIWPAIEIEINKNKKEEIDVLRDPRLDGFLGEKMIPVVWSFGNQGEEDHRLKRPQCIATNTKGEFVVLDNTTIKTYNSSGEYLNCSCLPIDCKCEFHTVDADTDKDGNLYLLAWKTSKDDGKNKEQLFEVFVFDKDCVFKNKFSLRNKSKGHKIALNSHGNHTEVFVLESGETGMHDMVGVYHYETEGVFDHQFGNGILQDAKDIVSATNGRILVLDKSGCGSKEESCVRVFDAGKQHLNFDVSSAGSVAVTYHQASQHIVIVSVIENRDELSWSIYNINTGRKERAYKREEAGILSDPDITVTSKGRIAIALTTQDCDGQPKGKVIVF